MRTSRGLRREIGLRGGLPTPEEVSGRVSGFPVYDRSPWNNQTVSFRQQLEVSLHNTVHVWVGGDMLLSTSPNDPTFFLHHCNVDRIWAAWQQKHPQSPYLPGNNASDNLDMHRLNDRMHTFFDHTVTPATFLDHTLYYEYDTVDDTAAPTPVIG